MRSPITVWRQRRVDDPAAAEEYGLYGQMSIASGIAVAECGARLLLDVECPNDIFDYFVYRCDTIPGPVGRYCGRHRFTDPRAVDRAIGKAVRRRFGWWLHGGLRIRRALLDSGARLVITANGAPSITVAAPLAPVSAPAHRLVTHTPGRTVRNGGTA